jgi:hypothetical protein
MRSGNSTRSRSAREAPKGQERATYPEARAAQGESRQISEDKWLLGLDWGREQRAEGEVVGSLETGRGCQLATALIAPDHLLDLAQDHGVPVVRYEASNMRDDLATLAELERGRTSGT